MKRFILLVVLGIAVLAWYRAESETMLRPPPAPAPVFMTPLVVTQVAPIDTRQPADGLPVPIYPGTRVTEAEIRPPVANGAPRFVEPRMLPPAGETDAGKSLDAALPPGVRAVAGRISATEERAQADARLQLRREVTEWLAPDIPAQWKPPADLIDRLVLRTRIKPVRRDYGTLYEATHEADLSPARRAEFIACYHRDLVTQRMGILGGSLGFTLVCLAALAGYIRADEATKGYYTNGLRTAAAAGVGASGVLIYHLLA